MPKASSKIPHAHTSCPCRAEEDQALPYGDCCGRWHAGYADGVFAPTPEALMRSRYSAYVLGLLRYLLATWHASTAPGDLELPPTKWLGLRIVSAQHTSSAGVVEFIARWRDGSGRAERLHEISRFVHEHGQWWYVDGQFIPT